MCLSPSSSDKHTKSSPCTAILTSWFALGNNVELCLPLRTPPWNSGKKNNETRKSKHGKAKTRTRNGGESEREGEKREREERDEREEREQREREVRRERELREIREKREGLD